MMKTVRQAICGPAKGQYEGGRQVVRQDISIPRSLTCIALPSFSPRLSTVALLSLGTALPSSALVIRSRCMEKLDSAATRW